MNNRQYKLLVFDWDGTLVDSIERIVTSLQHASRQVCGIEVSEGKARSVIGLGLHEAIEKLYPDPGSINIEAVAQSYSQHYLYDNPIPADLFAGVEDMLQQLSDDKYTLAIATGKSRRGLDRALTDSGVGHFFSTTRCPTENRSKPHPDMLNSILQTHDMTADQTLMIGDSEHDFIMAENAGVNAVGVSHGVQDAEALRQHKLVAQLDNITDLYGFLSHNEHSL